MNSRLGPWAEFLTSRDHEVARKSGYGEPIGFGRNPAVLVIDVNVGFCGDRSEPILVSMERWRSSCGEEAWQSISVISGLVSAARDQSVPVIYSTCVDVPNAAILHSEYGRKNRRRGEDVVADSWRRNDIVEPLKPSPDDIVISKTKPSVFFGTPLLSYLIALDIDTLICCGGTTSGCVRATVVDGYSYGYRVSILEGGTFDRTEASHAISLYDMVQKYADVVPLTSVQGYFSGLNHLL